MGLARHYTLPAGGLGAGDGAFLLGVSQAHFGLPAASMPRAWRRLTIAETELRLFVHRSPGKTGMEHARHKARTSVLSDFVA